MKKDKKSTYFSSFSFSDNVRYYSAKATQEKYNIAELLKDVKKDKNAISKLIQDTLEFPKQESDIVELVKIIQTDEPKLYTKLLLEALKLERSSNKNVLNLIDFDDTLFFTKDALYDAYKNAFERIREYYDNDFPQWGEFYTKEEWNEVSGKPLSKLLIEKYKMSRNDALIIKELKYKIYPAKYLDEISYNVDLFNEIKDCENNIICTNTSKDVVKEILEYNNIDNHFKDIIDLDDVYGKAKPNADIYIKAIENNLTEDITEINIFEDSTVGLMAAHKARNYFTNLTIPIIIHEI